MSRGLLMKRALLLSLWLLLGLAHAAPEPVQSWPLEAGWRLKWSDKLEPRIPFRGLVNRDAEGSGPGAMMYPAPSAAGFLVAILTHAAINESVQSSQRAKAQLQADKVLDDYRGVLDALTPERLMERTRSRIKDMPDPLFASLREATEDTAWTLELLPLFSMTQDKRALILDAAVQVRGRGTETRRRQLGMRVVSSPLSEADVGKAWLDDEGQALHAQAANLLAEAVQTLAQELSGHWADPTVPQRTLRFPEGGRERIERAQLLKRDCRRALLRTLKGELLSVPVGSGALSAECGPVAPTPVSAQASAQTEPAGANP
ncbi:hypothetical protein [Inhella proteolytica]|uniref:TraB/GumN family protein n=1 Tax=Inhella proteolytica TaxID=2795029 RepID=A0A931J5B1_9BURK|nr:hypothetical protein [Inhella proteolytica]MBH9579023.1 hypothetical protein [Inhella proteolytica]